MPYFHPMNKDSLPRGLYFLAGAAAGLAIGIYLNSEKGSALREQLAEHWDTLVDTIGEGAQEKMFELRASLNELLEKGLLLLDNLTEYLEEDIPETLAEVEDDAADLAEEVESYFESGMEKARVRLEQQFAKAGLDRET